MLLVWRHPTLTMVKHSSLNSHFSTWQSSSRRFLRSSTRQTSRWHRPIWVNLPSRLSDSGIIGWGEMGFTTNFTTRKNLGAKLKPFAKKTAEVWLSFGTPRPMMSRESLWWMKAGSDWRTNWRRVNGSRRTIKRYITLIGTGESPIIGDI